MAPTAHARAARAGRRGRALIGPRRGARHTGAVDTPNLFTMLSAYRPGDGSSPFEDYCANGLAYLLATGREPLGALFAEAAGAPGASVAGASVRPLTGGAAIADLALTFADGRRALVEVALAPETPPERPPAPRDEQGRAPAAVSVAPDAAGDGAVGWRAIADALAGAPDAAGREFAEFVRRDVLGLEAVDLDDALHTNRLYALGGAALRERFGAGARYESSASVPVGGRLRYLGTTFARDGGELDCWIGLVNEALPLSEHYHLMLGSRRAPLAEAAGQPRATGNWRWEHWTGLGRIVRPVAPRDYAALLARL